MFRFLLIFLSALFLTTLVQGQSCDEAVFVNYQEQGMGVRSAGMANAFQAVADDFSAIYWNPAGLAQIKQGTFTLQFTNLNPINTTTYLGTKTQAQKNLTRLSSLGIVYPFPVIRGSFVLAMGFHRFNHLDEFTEFSGLLKSSNNLAFHINNSFGDYGVLNFDQDVIQKEQINSEGFLSAWSFAAAIDLSPSLSAGVTVDLISGKNDYQMDYSQDDAGNGSNTYKVYDQNDRLIEIFQYDYYDVTQKITSEYSAIGVKGGIMYKLGPALRLAGTIHFPYSLFVREDWSVNDELAYTITTLQDGTTYPLAEPGDLGNGIFDYQIHVPFKFSGGVAWNLHRFLLSAGVSYQDFTQMKFEKPEDGDPLLYQDLLEQNPFFNQNYRAVLAWSVGGEVRLWDQSLRLRAGYGVKPSPLKDAPSWNDRKTAALGASLQLDKTSMLEFAYSQISWKSNKWYPYDWNGPGMETQEEHLQKTFQVGIKLLW